MALIVSKLNSLLIDNKLNDKCITTINNLNNIIEDINDVCFLLNKLKEEKKNLNSKISELEENEFFQKLVKIDKDISLKSLEFDSLNLKLTELNKIKNKLRDNKSKLYSQGLREEINKRRFANINKDIDINNKNITSCSYNIYEIETCINKLKEEKRNPNNFPNVYDFDTYEKMINYTETLKNDFEVVVELIDEINISDTVDEKDKQSIEFHNHIIRIINKIALQNHKTLKKNDYLKKYIKQKSDLKKNQKIAKNNLNNTIDELNFCKKKNNKTDIRIEESLSILEKKLLTISPTFDILNIDLMSSENRENWDDEDNDVTNKINSVRNDINNVNDIVKQIDYKDRNVIEKIADQVINNSQSNCLISNIDFITNKSLLQNYVETNNDELEIQELDIQELEIQELDIQELDIQELDIQELEIQELDIIQSEIPFKSINNKEPVNVDICTNEDLDDENFMKVKYGEDMVRVPRIYKGFIFEFLEPDLQRKIKKDAKRKQNKRK